jgi:hypothetical protein
MNDKIQLINIPVIFLILFLLTSFVLINYDYFTKNKDSKDEIKFYMYEAINIIFICILIFYISYHGYTKGIYETLFIWAFLAVCTPIPESGLLISLPLKKYFDVKMVYSQIVVSITAIFLLFLFYNQSFIKPLFLGKVFNDIIKNQRYLVFVISIISSIIGSELIDNMIDKILFYKPIENLVEKSSIFLVLIISYFFV